LNIKEIRQNTLDGSSLHLEISTNEGKINYRTAQNLAVIPENNEDAVLEVGEYLGLSLYQTVILDGTGNKRGKVMFPTPLKIKTILKNFCDFQGVIMYKFYFFLCLLNFKIKY
jgi:sulfite reductase alpha subunit-like flavoprotein